jgi:hypothetical protein
MQSVRICGLQVITLNANLYKLTWIAFRIKCYKIVKDINNSIIKYLVDIMNLLAEIRNRGLRNMKQSTVPCLSWHLCSTHIILNVRFTICVTWCVFINCLLVVMPNFSHTTTFMMTDTCELFQLDYRIFLAFLCHLKHQVWILSLLLFCCYHLFWRKFSSLFGNNRSPRNSGGNLPPPPSRGWAVSPGHPRRVAICSLGV